MSKKIKVNWWCRLFGHKFVKNLWTRSELIASQYKPIKHDFCVNCGLTKEDLKKNK